MKLIGHSKRKIYTIPEGEYKGVWYGYRCHLYCDKNIVFAHVDTATNQRKSIRVKVVIGNKPHAQIYAIDTGNKT